MKARSVVLAMVGCASVVSAQDDSLRAGWRVVDPEDGCVDGGVIRERLEEQLGPPARVHEAAWVFAWTVESADEVPRMQLEVTAPDGAVGRREIEGSCAEVTEAAALVMTMSVCPDCRAPEPSAPRELELPAVPEPEPEPEPASRARIAGALGAMVTFGILPGVALGVSLRGEVQPSPAWSVGVRAGLHPRTSENDPSGEATFLMAEAGVYACAGRLAATLRVGGCAGWTAALVRASGNAFANDRNALRLETWPEVSVQLGWGEVVGGRLVAGLLFPLVRDRYAVDVGGAARTLHRASTIAGRLTLELTFR